MPVVVTSFEIAIKDSRFLMTHHWKYLVVDEAHRLKNFECKLICQLRQLHTESRLLLADKARCVQIFALQALKLFGLFCLPYLCIRFMGLSPLGFWQVQLLTSLMLFVSNALPNVAGMGSIETAFLLVFGSFLEQGEVMSVLMLYRIASYYVVFTASAVGFFIAQRHLVQMEPPKEG